MYLLKKNKSLLIHLCLVLFLNNNPVDHSNDSLK